MIEKVVKNIDKRKLDLAYGIMSNFLEVLLV